MMPAVVINDPELTVSCPPAVTAHSGMDAFVQAVEAFVSQGANPLTDALSLEASIDRSPEARLVSGQCTA